MHLSAWIPIWQNAFAHFSSRQYWSWFHIFVNVWGCLSPSLFLCCCLFLGSIFTLLTWVLQKKGSGQNIKNHCIIHIKPYLSSRTYELSAEIISAIVMTFTSPFIYQNKMRLVLLYLGRRGAGPVYSIEFAQALLENRFRFWLLFQTISGI